MSKVNEAKYNYLPTDPNLPLENLAGIFNNTSASYKFYWFLSILDCIYDQAKQISFRDLNIRMIALSWHTINFHKLSFGTQDNLEISIKNIIKKSEGQISENESKEVLISYLNENYATLKNDINHFNKKVPYHFLTPFIGIQKNNKEWILKSEDRFNRIKPCIYKLKKDAIIIHPKWRRYLQINQKILTDFTLWNFSFKFLQRYNPNVPNIPGKLLYAASRKSLTNQTRLWKLFLESNNINSIYTNEKIKDFDLDHFIPWSFVSHDQIWNLAPIEKSLNSSKSNKLPNKILVDRFCLQQFNLLEYLNEQNKIDSFKNILEDYSIIFKAATSEILKKDKHQFVTTLEQHINPMLQFAKNMGFQNWDYEM